MENNNNKVMSDEQIETLRMQIAVFGYICDMLADMQKKLILNQQLMDLPIPELAVENMQQREPLISYDGRIWNTRRRWAPTRKQLEILESVLEESGGAHPSKQKIKDITEVLSHHGQICEANVYTWFQNRRARLKRRLQDNGGGPDGHNNQPQSMMKMIGADDKLVSTSTSYNNNNDHATQVDSMSGVNNYVRF